MKLDILIHLGGLDKVDNKLQSGSPASPARASFSHTKPRMP
jgi:hypothetical protein